MDISKLCRSCIKEVASWEKENFDQRAVEMFCFCTNIKISEHDKLPRQFCYDCTIRIESSYTFIIEAQRVDVSLRSMVPQPHISVIVETEANRNFMFDEPETNSNEEYNSPPCITDILQSNNSNVIDTIQSSDFINNSNKNESLPDDGDKQQNELINNYSESNIYKEDIVEELQSDHNAEKLNICHICSKRFTTKTWYSKHMKKEHAESQYKCTYCCKTFSKRQLLAQHVSMHSEERPYSCEICAKRFKRRKQLTIHIKIHSEVRPYLCSICKKCFKMKTVLKRHMKVHQDDKLHLCYLCGWSFSQAGNLAVHMRTHTGERPHRCRECAFTCSAASSLRRHEHRHRSLPRHLCTTCHKRFYDGSGLARHKRTHTGELPYKCPQCTHSFLDSWKRKTHMMRVHRLTLQNIPKMTRDGQVLQL